MPSGGYPHAHGEHTSQDASRCAGDELRRERVLACAVRLLDVGMFRIGSEQYADESGGVGLATISKQHVSVNGDSVAFDYPAKGGVRRIQTIVDPRSLGLVRALKRRRGGDSELLAYGRRRADRCMHVERRPGCCRRYLSGWTIATALERIPHMDPADDRVRTRIEAAVLDLLTDSRDSSTLERGPSRDDQD